MNELLLFKQRAHKHNICEPLAKQWDNAKSLKDIADTGLNIQGIEFLCKATAEGWGIDSQFICDNFTQFINGKYAYNSPKGYTTSLYVKNEDELRPTTTCTCLIDCTCIVSVNNTDVCSLYITGKSEIVLYNEGYCSLFIYGNADVNIKGNGHTHITRINNNG